MTYTNYFATKYNIILSDSVRISRKQISFHLPFSFSKLLTP